MKDKTVCTRCGYTSLPEARYCAHCGQALIPPRTHRVTGTGRWFENLTSRFLGLVGLIAVIPIGVLAHHQLVDSGLLFSLSHLSLALIIGAGSLYLGWQWECLPSNCARMLVVFIAVGLLLVAVGCVDEAAFGLLVAPGRLVISDIPGVHIEAMDGVRRISVDAPPYWLLVAISAAFLGTASSLARRLYTTLMKREREVDDLRENLLAQVQDTAAQQERNRLARELHDSIKQQIFGISMSAAAIEAHWETDPLGAQTLLADLRSVAHEAMVEMNVLLQQLSPAPLEKVGLVQALRDQCEALGYRTGAQVTAECGALPPNDRLPAGAQENIFRIVQEAFSNTARHARAAQVSLYLGLRDGGDALTLRIQDDGQGFDPQGATEGMGLDNIRQRVTALSGALSIDSDLDRGTELQVTVPLVRSPTHLGEVAPKQNHILNKVCLIGLVGGLMLIAALFYPLYVLLPGDTVDGWMAGSQLLSLMLEIVAALMVIAAGFLAARWARPGSRQTGALFGALAGCTAGIVLYLGIGAAAAAVVGSGVLLRHGLIPAAGADELARLVAVSTIGIVWWSHAVFWACLLTGLGLGAAGGLLAPVAAKPADTSLRATVKMMLIPGIWVNMLHVIFNVTVLSLLEQAVRSTIAAPVTSFEAVLQPQHMSLWPVGSAAVFFLAPLVALYFLSRGDVDARDRVTLDAAQSTAVVFGLLSFGIATYLLIVSPRLSISLSSPVGVVIVIVALVSLVLGGAYLTTFFEVRQQRRSLGFTGHPPVLQIVAAAGVLWSLAMVIWGVSLPLSWGLAVGLIVTIVDVVLLVVLRRQPRRRLSNAITLVRLQTTVSQMVSAGISSGLVMLAPMAPTNSSGLSLLTIMTRANAVLVGYRAATQSDTAGLTMAGLVRDAYLAQARLALIMLVGGVAAVTLLMLAISGIIAFIKHRVPQDS